ncbi:MAG: flagellin FliC [Bdellovibrionaceae bacterium]|nr:flagellin FliC [Pseudobdellovibrionaceae bacterium]|tara:strand:+ start:45364 stop:46197 length:834 start_codon:yes stop_codon:yes gene_type:complete
MSLRIGTNVASLAAQHNLSKSNAQKLKAIKSLSSGNRITQASDDAAGFAIAENLRGQLKGLEQVKRNANSAVSLVQVAEGGLNEQNNILIRLRELGVQAASDTVSEQEREFLQVEFSQLLEELDRIASSTNYGSKKLLSGSGEEFEFHVGANAGEENIIRYTLDADASSDSLGVSGLSVDDKDNALDSLESIDEGLIKMAEMRSSFGAMQSRLLHTSNHLDNQIENVAGARSLIADADVAKETADLVQADILQSTGVAILAQANNIPRHAERLINML